MKRKRRPTARRAPELRLELEPDEMILDSFAGGGGASTGLDMAFGRAPDIAVNHDPEAIAMHRANHPDTKHFVQDVFEVDIAKLCKGRRVACAWFSPDCTYHSRARGGKPFRDRNKARRRRGLAGVVVKWAKQVRPRVIILENVSEFADWGPLDEDGRPCPKRRGLSFRRWWAQMENLGYRGEMRELKACDFGAPTTRKRLYIVFRCDGRDIVWPEPTHVPREQVTRPRRRGQEPLQPYVPAAACIDWSIPTKSIFGRKKPLKPNTLRRIAKGVWKYVINAQQPFIIPVTHAGDDRSHGVDEPMRTITAANRGEHALITPFMAPVKSWGGGGNDPRSLEEPMRTVTTSKRGEHAVIAPVLIQTSYGERKGQAPRVLDIHAPLGTVVAGGVKHSVVTAFLAKHFSERKTGGWNGGAELDKPAGTVTVKDHHALVTSHLLKLYGTAEAGQAVTEPMPTVTATGQHIAEVRAFLIKYFGTDQDPKLGDPLHTVTTKHRFGLITVMIGGEEYAIVDIQMRMLEPHELAAAQGFKPGYQLAPKVKDKKGKIKPLTKTAQVRMIGNSVCPPVAAALARAQFQRRPAQQLGLQGVG